MKNNLKKIKFQRGALLLELLIVISILAIILSVSANATFSSLKSNKSSGERDVSSSLASETLEAVRSIAEEDYQNIYGLTKGVQHYYPTSTDASAPGRWIPKTGDENIVLNGITYTRYFTVDNVSRDDITRNIQTTYSGTYDDPSTQKVTINVSWAGGSPIVLSEYFFRWKNKICGQPGWTTADPGDTVHPCANASYDSKDTSIDISTGSIKLQ
jgi:type II secretory pathway pseudopilin PulG